MPLERDLDLPRSLVEIALRWAFVRFDVAEPNTRAERMAVRPGADEPDPLAVPPDRLAVVEQRLCVVKDEVDEPTAWHALFLLADERVSTDEPAGLVELDGEREPRLERRVHVADVVTEIAVRLLETKARERLQPGMAQPELAPGRDDPIVDIQRVLGGDVELPTELAENSVCSRSTRSPGPR